jgi:hypothetical protein
VDVGGTRVESLSVGDFAAMEEFDQIDKRVFVGLAVTGSARSLTGVRARGLEPLRSRSSNGT